MYIYTYYTIYYKFEARHCDVDNNKRFVASEIYAKTEKNTFFIHFLF